MLMIKGSKVSNLSILGYCRVISARKNKKKIKVIGLYLIERCLNNISIMYTINFIKYPKQKQTCILSDNDVNKKQKNYNFFIIININIINMQIIKPDTPVIIVQCCTNCKYHVWCTRHNEWKYIEHFNQLKKKIEKHLKDCILVRNPIPDGLIKLDDPTGQQNKYLDQSTQQAVIFPRLGSFEIYIYDMLIFSKLELNQWPNHYKIVELLQNIIEDKKKGLDITKYSLDQNIGGQDLNENPNRLGLKLPQAVERDTQQKKQLRVSDYKIPKKQLKLPPASKTYKKFYRSRNEQAANQAEQDKKKKSKLKPQKMIQIPNKSAVKETESQIFLNNYNDTPIKSNESNLTDFKTNVIIESIGSSKVRNLDKQYTQHVKTQRQGINKLNKTVDYQFKKQPVTDRYRRDKDLEDFTQTSKNLDDNAEKGLRSENGNLYKEFTEQFHPIRIKSFEKGSFISQHPGRKAIYRKKNLEIIPMYGQIINKPKQKAIVHEVNIEIKNEHEALKKYKLNKQFEYEVNKSIIEEVANKKFHIVRPFEYQINKEIIEQNAKITYNDGGIQVSEKAKSQYSQQMSLQEIPQEYMKEFNDAEIQGDFTEVINPGDRVVYMKRDISIQLSEYFGGQVENISCQVQQEHQQLGINTELIQKVTLQIGVNTDMYVLPEGSMKSVKENEVQILLAPKENKKDQSFIPLGERKKNITDNQFYSLDRYQHAETKYHWIGRANYLEDQNTTKRCFFKEKVLFELYKILGIRSARKQLSYQYYANNNNQQYKEQLFLHVMTEEIPQLKYFHQFQEYHYSENIFPTFDFVSLKQSRNRVTIRNYGKLLASSRFLNDLELFSSSHYHIGFQMKNYEIDDFIKLLNLNYTPEEKAFENYQKKIPMSRQNKFVHFDKLSENIKLEFIDTLYQISLLDMKKVKEKIVGLEQEPNQFEKSFEQTLDNFIKFLDERRNLLNKQYQDEFLMYHRYKSFEPKIQKFWKNNFYIPLNVQYKDKKILLEECVNQFLTLEEQKKVQNKKILLIKGPSGSGKSSSLKFLKSYLEGERKVKNKVVLLDLQQKSNEQLKSLEKPLAEAQVVLVDNFQNCNYFSNILKHFNISAKQKKLIVTCDISNFVEQTVNSYFISIGLQQIEQCEILPLNDNQILAYTEKYISTGGNVHGRTADQINIDLFKIDEVRKNISNPGQLLYIIYFLKQLVQRKEKVNIYKLIKKVSQACIKFHREFCISSKSEYKNVENSLKAFSLKAFKENKFYLSIKEFPEFKEFQTDRYIDTFLDFYPIDLVSTLNKYTLYHNSFLYYYASCAICDIVQRGFKGINLSDITRNRQVIQFIKQRYTGRGGQNRLIDIIVQSKMNPNLAEQASNAITLLAKIGYIFSDINFEGVQIPNADLSFGVFYNTSFKLANIDGVTFFNANIINSTFDGASVAGVDFGMRKYSIENEVCCGALSLDGKYIALGSENSLLLFNSDTGKLVKTLAGHTDVVRNVFFSRDEVSVISISDDKSIKIWNISTGASITLKVPSKVGVVFNLEAQKICCASKDIVRVWSMKLMGGQVVLKGHSGIVLNVCFNNIGTLIATSSADKTAKLWSITGQLIKTFTGHQDQVHLVNISPNNDVLATASLDNTLRIWNMANGTQRNLFNFEQKISCMCFSPEEKYLIISQQKDYLIKVINIKSYQEAFKFEGHDDEVIKLEFDKFGEKLISVSLDKSIRVWNFTKFRESQFVEGHSQQVWGVSFHKNNQYAASVSADKTVKIWDIREGTELRTLIGHQKQIFTVAFSPIGTRVVTGGEDSTVRIWDIITGEQIKVLRHHEDWIYCVTFSNDGYLLATSDAAGNIVIWDVYNQKITAQLKGHVGEVYTTCFKKNNEVLASGGSDKIIKIWNVPNKKQIKALKAHEDNVWSVRFFRKEELLSGSKDGTLILWNYINGQVIKRLNCHSSVQCISIINDERIAFSLEDGKIKVIDIINDKELKIFRATDSVWNIDISNDNTKLIAGSADNTVRIYNLASFMQNREKFYLKFSNLVYNRNGEKSAKLVNSKLIMLTDLVKRKDQQIRLDNEAIQSISFSYNDTLVLMKQNDVYCEYNIQTEQQTEIININEYNKDSSQQLMFCKGKFPRKFEKCSFKKLRNATQQIIDIFDQ